ncbi:MHYT domain-containing protein [Legionella sp. CNM-4043-24]|uniref:MHYT domain-containing protein n=1 Tax=Legionella sp. CNM-4043-24 TaxID=3421646 RepID=UPI00403AF95B
MALSPSWFLSGPIPDNAIDAHYDWVLYLLSFAVAVFASYVTLGLVSRLRAEKDPKTRLYWLFGGAFTLGAGIWSMHFIGMLALVIPVRMEYDALWTAGSLFVSVLVSAWALFILQRRYSVTRLALGGVLIGFGVALMHYMGMEGMKVHLSVQYRPDVFIYSIFVAIVASEAALWLAVRNDRPLGEKQFGVQILSALVMGLAMCGMHYTGMSAAVFTPGSILTDNPDYQTLSTNHLALFVASVTILVISLALVISGYYKKMVIAIENEKEFLNAMLDNIEDGIIACDAQGKITVFNTALQKYINSNKVNKSLDDLPDLFSLYDLNNKPLDKERYPLRLALKGHYVHGMELIARFKNKISRRVIVDGQSIINSQGIKLGAVIVIHDVTDLKQTERLKNEFVSTVSHELRTPLTSIRGSLGLLSSGVMGTFSDKAGKLLTIANNNCDRLLFLINDILDMEKIEAGKMQYDIKPVSINDLVRRCIDDNKMYAEKFQVKVQLMEPAMQIQVLADPDRLAQVLANLISNACKFSPAGGRVTISITHDDDKVHVAITDTGAGIPHEFQSRLFQKFSQADASDTRVKGGTGLGLYISKCIIETFGGKIGCFSKPGEGATFYFDLDVMHLTEPVLQPLSDAIKSPDVKRLLVCEDDEDQSDYLKILLESAGFTVDVADSVEQAKKLLQQHRYEILLLDLILPDQDGIAFIRELRTSKQTEELHIIVLSVIAQTGRALLKDDGISIIDWLDKPVDFKKLLQSIKGICYAK